MVLHPASKNHRRLNRLAWWGEGGKVGHQPRNAATFFWAGWLWLCRHVISFLSLVSKNVQLLPAPAVSAQKRQVGWGGEDSFTKERSVPFQEGQGRSKQRPNTW